MRPSWSFTHVGLKVNHTGNVQNMQFQSSLREACESTRGLREAHTWPKATTQVLTSGSLSRHSVVQILLTSWAADPPHHLVFGATVTFRGCEATKLWKNMEKHSISCNSYPPNSLMFRIRAAKHLCCQTSMLRHLPATLSVLVGSIVSYLRLNLRLTQVRSSTFSMLRPKWAEHRSTKRSQDNSTTSR